MSHWPTSPGEPVRMRAGTRSGQRGVALVLAIVAVFLLTVAVFQTRAGVDLVEEIALSTAQEQQALYMARSGLAMVREALAEDDPLVDSYSDDWAAANEYGAVPIAEIGWATGRVSDEEGKFSVLDLVNQEGGSDEVTLEASFRLQDLLVLIGVPESRAEEIVDSLIDWMDSDSTVTGSGAEDSYYSALVPPYESPDGLPAGIDELALVRGIGPVLLHQGEGEVPPLVNYLTVYGARKPGDKYRRVNINTAPREVIMALDPQIDSDLAEEIVELRGEEAFTKASQVKEVPGFPGDEFFSNILEPLIDVSSSHFSARIVGETSMASSRAYGVFVRSGEMVELVYYRGY